MRSRMGAVAVAVAVALLSAPAAAHADPTPSPGATPSPEVTPSPDVTPTPGVTSSPGPYYDLVAIGASGAGAVGSTVELTVGVQNLGPLSTMPPGVPGGPKRFFLVELPVGAELIEEASTICGSAHFGLPPDPRRFDCAFLLLEPGERKTVTFHVKITAPITAKGGVSLGAFGLGVDLDTNQANNTAPITITTGQLATTGTDSKMIAVIGSGAVLLGGLMLLVVRRFSRRRG